MTVKRSTIDQEIAEFLGIDLKNRMVTGFTLRVRPDSHPTVIVQEVIDKLPSRAAFKRYALVEISPARLPVVQPLPSSPMKEGVLMCEGASA